MNLLSRKSGGFFRFCTAPPILVTILNVKSEPPQVRAVDVRLEQAKLAVR